MAPEDNPRDEVEITKEECEQAGFAAVLEPLKAGEVGHCDVLMPGESMPVAFSIEEPGKATAGNPMPSEATVRNALQALRDARVGALCRVCWIVGSNVGNLLDALRGIEIGHLQNLLTNIRTLKAVPVAPETLAVRVSHAGLILRDFCLVSPGDRDNELDRLVGQIAYNPDLLRAMVDGMQGEPTQTQRDQFKQAGVPYGFVEWLTKSMQAILAAK